MDHHFTNWRWYWHPKKLNPASFSWFLMIIRLIHLKDVCNMDKAAMVTPSLQRGQGFRKFHGRSISDGSLGNAESLDYEKETHKNIWFPDSKLLRSLKLFTVCRKLFDGFELKMMRLETELKNVGWNIVWYTNRQHVHSKLYVTWTHRALLQQTQFCFPIQTFRIIPGLLQLYTFNLEFRAALLGLRQGGVLKAIKHGNWCEFFHVRSMYLYQLVSKHILYRVRQLQNVNSEQDAIDSRLSDRFSNHLLDGTFQLFGHHWFIIHIPMFIYRFSRCNLQLLAADTNSKLFNIFNNHSRVSPSGCPTIYLCLQQFGHSGLTQIALKRLISSTDWCWLCADWWIVSQKTWNCQFPRIIVEGWTIRNETTCIIPERGSSDQQPGIGSDQLGTPENTNMTPTIKSQEWSNAQG